MHHDQKVQEDNNINLELSRNQNQMNHRTERSVSYVDGSGGKEQTATDSMRVDKRWGWKRQETELSQEREQQQKPRKEAHPSQERIETRKRFKWEAESWER